MRRLIVIFAVALSISGCADDGGSRGMNAYERDAAIAQAVASIYIARADARAEAYQSAGDNPTITRTTYDDGRVVETYNFVGLIAAAKDEGPELVTMPEAAKSPVAQIITATGDAVVKFANAPGTVALGMTGLAYRMVADAPARTEYVTTNSTKVIGDGNETGGGYNESRWGVGGEGEPELEPAPLPEPSE